MVELLKNIAQKNGQSEQKDLFPDWAFCQGVAVAVHDDHFLWEKLHSQQLCYTPEIKKCQELEMGKRANWGQTGIGGMKNDRTGIRKIG